MYRIICAPDSFKGSLSSVEAAEAMGRGIREFDPGLEVITLPLSDGGEGLTETLVSALGGRFAEREVQDPRKRKVRARYGVLPGGRGVMEMAAASGLTLLTGEERNPLLTTTYGTGELILALLDEGCEEIILGIGGSATNDGGMGMARALGAKFYGPGGEELPDRGEALKKVAGIDLSGLDPRIKEVSIRVACDVDNPLWGREGAARIYGPQKGATPEMVEELDRGLSNLDAVIKEDLGLNVGSLAGAGAAGGLGAGLWAFLGGKLEPGVDLVLSAVGLEEMLSGAELILTGEGKLDRQTVRGKVPFGVACKARKWKVPVVALGGWVEPEIDALKGEGLTAAFSILDRPLSLGEAMERAGELIARCSNEIARLYFAGRN